MGRELHVRSHPSVVEHWRHLVEIVALLAAAAWGLYVFVYQERIKPANAAPDVQRVATVTHEALPQNKEFVKVNIDMRNLGQTTAELGGLVVNVYGSRYTQRNGNTVNNPVQGLATRNLTLSKTKPVLLYSFFDVWRPLGDSRTFLIEPGQVIEEPFDFAVHAGAYDVVAVEMFFCYARPGSRVWPSPRVTRPDGSYWVLMADGSRAPNSGLMCRKQIHDYRI